MSKTQTNTLSRRERQIMDLVCEHGECSARQIQAEMPDAPGYSSIRTLLAILVEKGHLQYRLSGARYLYSPARPLEEIRQNAVERLVKTFFRGSIHDAVNSLIGYDARRLSKDELDSLADLIASARKDRK